MKTRATTSSPSSFGSLHATALICLGAVVLPAHADPSVTGALSPTEVARSIPLDATAAENPSRVDSKPGTGVTSAGGASNSDIPRGNEMSVLAGVELERTDRKFRARVVDWARDQSAAAGLATNFLLHGSDTGFHLRLKSRSEYVVRWETRF